MAFIQKELCGSLFKNDDKQADNHPDYKGTAKVNGVEYYVSAWVKDGQKGKWMSLSFKDKASVARRAPATGSAIAGGSGTEQEVPF